MASIHSRRSRDQREGLRYKTIFFDLLSVTCLGKFLLVHTLSARSFGCLIVFTYQENGMFWGYLLSIFLPSLLFVSTACLFIYFFAIMVAEEENSQTMIKPFFVVFNSLAYLGFFVIALVCKRFHLNTQIAKRCSIATSSS